MNKIYFFFLLLFVALVDAQPVRLTPHNTSWLPVRSYSGITVPDAFNFRIHVQNNSPYQMDNWTLVLRLRGNISNDDQPQKKVIDPVDYKNFQLIFNRVQSDKPNHDGLTPTAANIGVISTPIPFSSQMVLVPYSPYSLHAPNFYMQMQIWFNVRVQGGAYLEKYKSWSNYKINFDAVLINRKGVEVAIAENLWIDMQIHPDDSPPVEPTYSFTLNPTASNVLLEFKTPNDYLNGVTEQKQNAVSVISTTPYTVQVQALSSTLNSANATLPIETVNVSMLNSSTQAMMGSVPLSTAKQTLLTSGAHSDARNYDLRYKITPPNMGSGFFNKPYETYSAIIVYSLTPQ